MSFTEYNDFEREVMNRSRYVLTEKANIFLNNLLSSCKDNAFLLPVGSKLYRAQKGCITKNGDKLPLSKNRMIPKADKVRNGRVNSIKIPVLYVSDNEETAIAETRPWIMENISLATFISKRELKIINMPDIAALNQKNARSSDKIQQMLNKTWADVSFAFSKPVNIDDQDTEYIPTQIIGEFFKKNGFDGIEYNSLVSAGNNYALYDIHCCKPECGMVVEISAMSITPENGIEYDYK